VTPPGTPKENAMSEKGSDCDEEEMRRRRRMGRREQDMGEMGHREKVEWGEAIRSWEGCNHGKSGEYSFQDISFLSISLLILCRCIHILSRL
jgi:hypothetical protein